MSADPGLFNEHRLATEPTVYRSDLLRDQVFLISGGGSGIGRATAFLATRLGAQVMICGRRAEKLAETAAAISQHLGRTIDCLPTNIRDPEQVDALVAHTVERYGRIDCLVNSAGGQFRQEAIDFSKKGWNAVIDTNLNGTWNMIQAVGQHWRNAKRPGNVVNIVLNLRNGRPYSAHTGAARAGVISLTQSLAIEWAPLDIRVNCIAPGTIDSSGLDTYDTPVNRQRMRNNNPMRRLGSVWEIAEGVVYLAGPSGSFITGELLAIDGGAQLWGPSWPEGRPEHFRDVE